MTVETRTYSWTDPAGALAHALTLDGSEQIAAAARGDLPVAPIAATLGLGEVRLEDDAVLVDLPLAGFHANPLGVVHGGVVAALLDTAMWLAIHRTLEPGRACATLDLHVTYVRPLTPAAGHVIGRGTLVSRSRRVASARGEVLGADGRLYAHSTTTGILGGDDA